MTTVTKIFQIFILSLILMACASSNPTPGVIKTVLLYPPIPYEKLSCQLEPAVPDRGSSQEAVAEWAERVRQSGQDCRGNLDFLRAYVLTWESKVDQSDIWVEEGDDF